MSSACRPKPWPGSRSWSPTPPLENIDVTGIAALWAASAGAGLLATLLALVVPLLIYVFTYAVVAGVLALLIWIPHRAVPSRHRRIYGFSIFLTIIPVFGVLWNFRVASRVPDSFRSYFDAHPDAAAPPPGAVGGATVNVGTAGKSLGLWYAGLTLGSWLAPWTCVLAFLLFPLGLAALVLYILFIVKLFALAGAVNEHKRRPRQATPALAPPPASIPTTPPPSTAPATPPATPPAAS